MKLSKPNCAVVLFALLGLSACGTKSNSSPLTPPAEGASEDVSTSGTVASSIGGALSASSPQGTLATSQALEPKELLEAEDDASHFKPEATSPTVSSCPSFRTLAGPTCTSSKDTLWYSYKSCSFGSSDVARTGVQALTVEGDSTAVACGKFPHHLANNSVTSQYVTAVSATTPGTATITTKSGAIATIDHATLDLNNFDTGTKISPNVGTGYGSVVQYAVGVRRSLDFAQHVYVKNSGGHVVLDNSTYTSKPLTVNETNGVSSRSVSGTVTTYHNLLKVIGVSTLSALVHHDDCCFPVSGSIKTEFTAGNHVQPTTAGSLLVGKSETLTLTGCGTATLTDTTGKTTAVTLSRCM